MEFHQLSLILDRFLQVLWYRGQVGGEVVGGVGDTHARSPGGRQTLYNLHCVHSKCSKTFQLPSAPSA